MSWQPEADEIAARNALALEQGGKRAVEKQHARGRQSVRERFAALSDADSFREYGTSSGVAERNADGQLERFTPANTLVGVARLGGRPVVLCGDDFTLAGAAYSPAGMKKALFAEDLALRRRMPLVRLLEGGGASIAGATETRGRSGYDWTSPSPMNLVSMRAMSEVPVVCAALGPVAGFPAARLTASHFSLMTRKTAVVLTGGPVLVERATGEKLSKEELGGPDVHGANGVVNNVVADEQEAMEQIQRFLSYLPSSVYERAPVAPCSDPRDRREEKLLASVPRNRRRAFKVRRVIELVVDLGSFFELSPGFGRSQVTGFARVAGQPVGVIANDCYHDGGSMTADGAQKIRRFVETCDAFHLPILSFVDEPGFKIGGEAERAATIRHGMNAVFAISQTEVPWFCVMLRRSFGVAAGIHLGPPGSTVAAWPSAEAGALPVESGVALAFAKDIAAADDPDARRAQLEDEMAAAQSVFPRAEEFGAHHLIDPRDTRPLLCDWVEEIQHQLTGLRGPRSYTMRP